MRGFPRRRGDSSGAIIGGDSWAGYSDLIAGVLLIFILVTVLKDFEILKKDFEIQKMIAEPAEILNRWQEAMNELCRDQDLMKLEIVLDCTTGTIELPDKVFFGFNETELTDVGKTALRQAVPIILKKLRRQDAIWGRLNVEVRGHADPRVSSDRDKYQVNLAKSARRAETVLLFLTTDDAFEDSDRQDLRRLSVASGASDQQVPAACAKVTDDECFSKMRRVEIHLRLEDKEIRAALIRLLDQFRPGAREPEADARLG